MFLMERCSYPSSHNHGSEKWVPPIGVAFQISPFSTAMIMGERAMEKLLGKMIRDSWKTTSDFSAAFCFSMTGQSALVEFSLSSFNSIAGGSHLSLGIPTNCRAVWWHEKIGKRREEREKR